MRFQKKHGLYGTSIYRAWHHVLDRCRNKNNKRYMDYGGRGIKVCEKWLTFEGFYEDMGEAYFDGASLDRIDVNGDYCKENCRWVTMAEQARNKRNNNIIEFNGEKMCLVDWANRLGICHSSLYERIYEKKWPLEKALILPNQKGKYLLRNTKGYTYDKKRKKYRAHFHTRKFYKFLGDFNTPEEAHQAYLAYRKQFLLKNPELDRFLLH